MNRFTLTTDLTVAYVNQLMPELQRILAKETGAGKLALGMGQVSAVDGAGLQLLLSFWHAATEAGCEVVLLDASNAVEQVLTDYDLADRFTLKASAAELRV